MATQPQEQSIDYLVIGGGLAAATAAEEIRKQDVTGSIVLVTNDSHLPYHRPPLSKEYLRSEIDADGTYGEGGIYVQLPNWYEEQNVTVLRGSVAVELDTKQKTVRLSDDRLLIFRTLLLATGGRPRQIDIPGANLPEVHLLRTLDDATAIRQHISKGQRIVIVGSGFIGLESAADALMKDAQVTIVEPQERIWPHVVTPELSAYFQQQFESHGAKLYYGYSAQAFIADQSGHLASVRIAPSKGAGQTQDIPCDLVIVGIGIQLNTELASAAGLEVDDKHGIVVDEHLETQVADIFAAGDVAGYPDPFVGRMHFEHWDNAIGSAQIAAANMLGGDEPYRHVPYFFSDQFDLSINMLGYTTDDAQVVIRGDMQQKKFTAFFIQENTLKAALMVNDDAQMDLLKELIAAQAPTGKDFQKLADANFDLKTLMPTD